jgi:cytochrome c556
MIKPSRFLPLTGLVLAASLLTACGGGGMAEDDSPEGQAFQFRDSVMHLLAAKMGTIGGMAREEIPLDDAVFNKAVHDLAALSGMVTEGFMPEGIPAGSRSLPDVWTNWSDFEQKAQDLQDAADGLVASVERGGFAAAKEMVQGTAQTCGGCHRSYRERTE